jgi:cleavage and polyadenylation specificity factor subunit 1
LALLTAPGRDDRTILAEEDCINTKAMFSLPSRGLVLLAMAEGGIRFLKLETAVKTTDQEATAAAAAAVVDPCLIELDMEEWATEEASNLLAQTTLLAAGELDDDNFVLLVAVPIGEDSISYWFVILSDETGTLDVKTHKSLSIADGLVIQTVTPFTKDANSERLTFGYTLSSGDAKVVSLDGAGSVEEYSLEAEIPMELEEIEQSEEEKYYAVGKITAIDIFKAPKAFFSITETESSADAEVVQSGATEDSEYLLDDDDKELYGHSVGKTTAPADTQKSPSPENDSVPTKEDVWYIGICRQSGLLEVYLLSDFIPGQDPSPVWKAYGCGHGVPQLLSEQQVGSAYRAPRMHKLYTSEMRFFFCGPSSPQWENVVSGPRPFCLTLESTLGDTLLYTADINTRTMALKSFSRVSLKSVTRPSQEQAKHFAKLRRKGIVGAKDSDELHNGFRYNHLFRFNNVSGQDGVFAAVARPIWLVAERGKLTTLCHRSRHAAPAGARPRSVTGFCSGLLVSGTAHY